MISTPRIEKEELAALADTYRLFARLWLREVDQPLLKALTSPPMSESFSVESTANIEELSVEFCRLFVGPCDHLPPHQSVWQKGQFQSRAVTSMRDFVEVVHYRHNPHRTLMLDHLGVQLDVMATICDRADGDFSKEVIGEIAPTFFRRHLTWPTGLFDAVQSNASAFYRSVATLTRDFLSSENSRWNVDAAT